MIDGSQWNRFDMQTRLDVRDAATRSGMLQSNSCRQGSVVCPRNVDTDPSPNGAGRDSISLMAA